MTAEENLVALGIVLPDAPAPKAMYVSAKIAGNLLFISGQLPTKDGVLLYTGHLGLELTTDEGCEATRLCAINILSVARQALGSLDRVKSVAKIQVFVSSANDFTEQHLVANGASELLFSVFEQAGQHARSAVGVPSLPLNSAVEVEAIFEIE